MVRRVLGEDIDLQLLLSPRPLAIHADPGLIDQVLMNLVINARDAMPAGGWLRIETAARSSNAGDQVVVRVVDSGTGIPATCLPRIFDPFYTTKEAGKGSGLGLATAFGIVAQHGGRIDVSSTVGRGTTFEVVLPATPHTAQLHPRVSGSRGAAWRHGNHPARRGRARRPAADAHRPRARRLPGRSRPRTARMACGCGSSRGGRVDLRPDRRGDAGRHERPRAGRSAAEGPAEAARDLHERVQPRTLPAASCRSKTASRSCRSRRRRKKFSRRSQALIDSRPDVPDDMP